MHGIQRICRSGFSLAKGCPKDFYLAPAGPAFNPGYKRKGRISEVAYFEGSARIPPFGWNKDRVKNSTDLLHPARKGKLGEQQTRLCLGALPRQRAAFSGEDNEIVSGELLIDNSKKGAPMGGGLSPKKTPMVCVLPANFQERPASDCGPGSG